MVRRREKVVRRREIVLLGHCSSCRYLVSKLSTSDICPIAFIADGP